MAATDADFELIERWVFSSVMTAAGVLIDMSALSLACDSLVRVRDDRPVLGIFIVLRLSSAREICVFRRGLPATAFPTRSTPDLIRVIWGTLTDCLRPLDYFGGSSFSGEVVPKETVCISLRVKELFLTLVEGLLARASRLITMDEEFSFASNSTGAERRFGSLALLTRICFWT